jgi:hypothetical protein
MNRVLVLIIETVLHRSNIEICTDHYIVHHT